MNTPDSAPRMTRRVVLAGAVGTAALLGLNRVSARAQTSTPVAGDFSSLGFPELNVTITDSGYEGIPESLPAGRYLLNATANTSEPSSPDQQPPTIAFLSPTPAGMSANDFLQMFMAPPPDASPSAGGDQGGGDQGGGDFMLPLPVYQMKFAGGTMVVPGQSEQAIVDLTAGEWIAWGDDPEVSTAPTIFTVTGDFPADVQDPDADITATLIDFAISFEGTLKAGKQVIKVQHQGAQPHFLELDKGPDSMTKEEVEAALSGEMSGTPTAGGVSDSDLHPVFYSPTQSIGTTTWHHIDLPSGTLLAACFFPTAGTGVPHAMNGMIDVIKVSE